MGKLNARGCFSCFGVEKSHSVSRASNGKEKCLRKLSGKLNHACSVMKERRNQHAQTCVKIIPTESLREHREVKRRLRLPSRAVGLFCNGCCRGFLRVSRDRSRLLLIHFILHMSFKRQLAQVLPHQQPRHLQFLAQQRLPMEGACHIS